jgi:hypothetical protein
MGTTPDCGPHCTLPTATKHETHCSCTSCHGKPLSAAQTGYAPLSDEDEETWPNYGAMLNALRGLG